MWNLIFNLVFLLVFVNGDTLNLSEGDSCEVGYGRKGFCKHIAKCTEAATAFKNGHRPKICSFGKDALDIFVCCDDTLIFKGTPGVIRKKYTDENGCVLSIDPKRWRETGWTTLNKCMEYQQQLCSCGKHSADTSADGAEISGAHAERNPFSHVVHLGYGENITSAQWLCEGSLISRRFVITAGHCAGGPRTGQVKYAAFGVIRSDLKNEELVYNVKRIMRHPDFSPPWQRNDIALLEIDRNIVFSPRIQPACLNVDIEVETDEGSTTSWMLGNMEDSADTLQEVKLYKFSNQECNRQYSSINARIFKIDDVTQTCYGYRTTPTESCKGDSGGPLVIRNKFQCLHSIIGLTSIGSVCSGTEKPGVYTKVYPYLSWIEDIVWPTMLK